MDPHSITTVPASAAHFMTARHYAVVGRVLQDPSRFDNRAIKWYAARGMDVLLVRPPGKFDNSVPVEGHKVLNSVSDIPDLPHTSLSVIISPALGLEMLRTLFAGAPATWPVSVWFQPGAESPEIAAFVRERGLEERVIMGGLCLFVHGDRAREMAKL